ncbi:hypothetical protein [Nonomuraea dietziae]|uniref:hypothetical protein n=1 Tax=Nonomuraea dietziae TaxID=65515 RepID=UPI003426203A
MPDAVVWVLGSRPGSRSVFEPARGFVQLMEEIEPLRGEPIITEIMPGRWAAMRTVDQLTRSQEQNRPCLQSSSC